MIIPATGSRDFRRGGSEKVTKRIVVEKVSGRAAPSHLITRAAPRHLITASPNSNLRNGIPKINTDFKVNEQNLHEKLAYFKVPLLNMLTDAKEHITSSSNAGDMPLGTTPDHYLHNHAYILVARSCSVVRQTPKLFCRRCLMRI